MHCSRHSYMRRTSNIQREENVSYMMLPMTYTIYMSGWNCNGHSIIEPTGYFCVLYRCLYHHVEI